MTGSTEAERRLERILEKERADGLVDFRPMAIVGPGSTKEAILNQFSDMIEDKLEKDSPPVITDDMKESIEPVDTRGSDDS